MSGQATSAMLPRASAERQASAERNAAASERRAKSEPSVKRAQSDKRVHYQTKKPASKRGRFSFVCKLKLFSFSFSNNGESNVSLDFLIQLNNSRIFTKFLSILHHDALAINFKTQLSQFFSNLDVAN